MSTRSASPPGSSGTRSRRQRTGRSRRAETLGMDLRTPDARQPFVPKVHTILAGGLDEYPRVGGIPERKGRILCEGHPQVDHAVGIEGNLSVLVVERQQVSYPRWRGRINR